jgi:hypothetical protein
MDLGQYAIAKALRVDPPRDEPKVKIRVVSRSDGHVIAAKILSVGENVLDVYASDVALFEREIETASMEPAKKRLAMIESGELPADLRPTTLISLEGAFRQTEGRDMRPLVSVSRVEQPNTKR